MKRAIDRLVVRVFITFFFALAVLSLSVPQAVAAENAERDKPLIGINMDVSDKERLHYRILPDYVNAIVKAGGVPVMIPPMPESDLPALLARLDGVMMIGGNDYPPELYGETPHPTVEKMHDERARFDVALMRAALKEKRLPVLGICAGCQALNIVSGGSLIQDIPSQIKDSNTAHARKPGESNKVLVRHEVDLEPGSKLAAIMHADKITVVSNHHQCVGKLGNDLKISGKAPDGVVESIESASKDFVVGVQFHPERDYANCEPLFKEFIRQGKKAHEERFLAGSN